jgi:hypothetical protein
MMDEKVFAALVIKWHLYILRYGTPDRRSQSFDGIVASRT